MAGGYWKNVFDDYVSAPQNGLILPMISNAFGKWRDNSDLNDSLSEQEALNRFSMENAKQVYDIQREADERGMQFSHDENELAWHRQMEASNTAYQRAVADMRIAGINPVLAYAQGGASTPSSSGLGGISSARQIPQLNLDNYVYQFKSLVRSLESSERNTDTIASAQKYSATLNAATNVFGTLAQMGVFNSAKKVSGFSS